MEFFSIEMPSSLLADKSIDSIDKKAAKKLFDKMLRDLENKSNSTKSDKKIVPLPGEAPKKLKR